MKYYYMINGKLMWAASKMPKIIDAIQSAESIDNYLIVWLNSLQPCSITENELCLILSNVAKLDYDNPIEVTDIVYEKPLITETKSGSWTDYEIVFKQPKSEANEAVTWDSIYNEYMNDVPDWREGGCMSITEWLKLNYNTPTRNKK